MFGAGVGGQLFFKLDHFGAQDVLAVLQHAGNGCIQLNLDAGLLGFEVDKFNHGLMPIA